MLSEGQLREFGTRRIVYYRLSCPDHPKRWPHTFTSAFTEYAPVRRALAMHG